MIMARGAKTEFIASSRSYMALINNDRAIMRAPEHLPESNSVCVCSSYASCLPEMLFRSKSTLELYERFCDLQIFMQTNYWQWIDK